MKSLLADDHRLPERVLMGPGPSQIHPRVLQALSLPTIGHLDPAFVRLMDDIKQALRAVMQTENTFTLPVSGPGSLAQEACIINLLEPGDKCVICINGVFGGRMKAMAERCGAQVITVEQAWGRAVDPQALRATLQAHPDAVLVGFVHAETSTGALSDAETLAGVAQEFDCLVLADTVTSLAGVPVRIDEWGLDAVYSGTQKCLSCPPGLGPVSLNERALERVRSRRTPVQSWFMDFAPLIDYWQGEKRVYHHTAPVNALYGLAESLAIVLEEGMPATWQRHRQAHEALAAGLQAMGLKMAVPAAERAPQLNAVEIPDGVDDASIRSSLLDQFGLEIGAGLGPLAGRIWRIGLMGQSATLENVQFCLSSLSSALEAQGHAVDASGAQRAAAAVG